MMFGCVSDENMELGTVETKHVVSWSDICEASAADADIQELLNLVRNGFTTDGCQDLVPGHAPLLPLQPCNL